MTRIYTTERNITPSDQNESTTVMGTCWLPFDKPTPMVSPASASVIRDIQEEKETQNLKSTKRR